MTPWPVWTVGKSRPHRDSIPDRPDRSQSLYRLSYPAHTSYLVPRLNKEQSYATTRLGLHGLFKAVKHIPLHLYPSNGVTIEQRLAFRRLSQYSSTSSSQHRYNLSPATTLVCDLRAMGFQRIQEQKQHAAFHEVSLQIFFFPKKSLLVLFIIAI